MPARDKVEHLVVGYLLALTVGVLFGVLPGVVTGVVVGALKEMVWDKWLGRGTPEALDFIATALGSLLAIPPLVLS